MPEYRITHQTIYRHATPAGGAWQMLQLQPRPEPTQECLDFQLEIDPAPSDLTTRAGLLRQHPAFLFGARAASRAGDHEPRRRPP
ncbi:MAG: transglutaminase N-terminal domain-containing protein [Lacunisphaera sp.]